MNEAGYGSRGARAALVAQDAVLVVALAIVIVGGAPSAFAVALAVGSVAVLAWGGATLHYPRRVTWNEETITFAAHGRAHAFAWKDVERVHVRRFLVGDRVFVRLVPAPAWRGRYWLLSRMDGYDALVGELERRRVADAPPRAGEVDSGLHSRSSR